MPARHFTAPPRPSSEPMGTELEDFVRQRAGGRCEYCHDPVPPFHIEHIIARKHGGRTVAENLALSCIAWN